MIIVSSLGQSEKAFGEFSPTHVVSILENDEAKAPIFESLSPGNHLKLIENCSASANCDGISGEARCERLIAFAKSWDRKAPLLIHCNEGVARSMAAAFIIMCIVEPDKSEHEIAERLRNAAPHADPNLLLISEADEILGRNDRMIEAVLDLCPSCNAVTAPIVALPVAA